MKRAEKTVYSVLQYVLKRRGAWVAQSVKHLTLAQVIISHSVSSSPASGSVRTARSLEPASDSVSPSLWPSLVHALSFSVSKINKHWGTWVAQSVKRPTSARSRSRGPWVRAPRRALGWWLRAWSLFPILCLPLSDPPSFMLCLSLSQK